MAQQTRPIDMQNVYTLPDRSEYLLVPSFAAFEAITDEDLALPPPAVAPVMIPCDFSISEEKVVSRELRPLPVIDPWKGENYWSRFATMAEIDRAWDDDRHQRVAEQNLLKKQQKKKKEKEAASLEALAEVTVNSVSKGQDDGPHLAQADGITAARIQVPKSSEDERSFEMPSSAQVLGKRKADQLEYQENAPPF